HQGEPAPGHLSHRLYTVRQRVERAAPLWPSILDEAEPRVRALLGAEDVASPLHVLMVGTFTTNAFVGRLGSEPAVFWCLEWFSNPEPARVLVAHETAHAFHQELLGGAPPGHDLAGTCLVEGWAGGPCVLGLTREGRSLFGPATLRRVQAAEGSALAPVLTGRSLKISSAGPKKWCPATHCTSTNAMSSVPSWTRVTPPQLRTS